MLFLVEMETPHIINPDNVVLKECINRFHRSEFADTFYVYNLTT